LQECDLEESEFFGGSMEGFRANDIANFVLTVIGEWKERQGGKFQRVMVTSWIRESKRLTMIMPLR
jgi:hypothetical protein